MSKLLPGACALFLVSVPFAGHASAQCTPNWDATFAPVPFGGPNDNVWDMDVFDDGSGPALYVAGEFTGAFLTAANLVARWDGSAWTALGTGIDTVVSGNEIVRSLEVFDDGTGSALYAAGDFPGAGGVVAPGLARWDGTAWTAVGDITGNLTELAVIDLGSGPALYMSGTVNINGGADHQIVRWDGTAATVIGDSTGWPYSLTMFDDGTGPALYAAGRFDQINGVSANRIAKWDGTSWSALGNGIEGPNFPRVRSIKVFDDGSGPALYAAGRFDTVDGQAIENIARWDGTSWSALGTGITGIVGAVVEDLEVFNDGLNGPELYAAGEFTTAGGAPAANLAKWTGSSWTTTGTGTESFITCLHTFRDDPTPSLFAGGGFASMNGQQVQKMSRLDTCEQTAFCFGTTALCPCANGGAADTGCDLAQGTGGVGLDLLKLTPDGTGGGQAIFYGRGFPPKSSTRALLIRSRSVQSPVTFGDGLLCLTGHVSRLRGRVAVNGSTDHTITHRDGPGTFSYQLWFRNLPATFCDPTAGFNTSNAYAVTWQ